MSGPALRFDARARLATAPRTGALDRRRFNPFLWMLLQGNSGLAALLTGDTDAARQAFREELTLCRELGFLPFASEGLAGLAAVSTVRGDDDRAARLLAPRPNTATASPRTPSTPDSTPRSSSRPAHVAEPTNGTPPPAKAARSASRTQSPTPSKNRPRRSERPARRVASNHRRKRPANAGLSMGDTGLEPVTSALSRRRSPS